VPPWERGIGFKLGLRRISCHPDDPALSEDRPLGLPRRRKVGGSDSRCLQTLLYQSKAAIFAKAAESLLGRSLLHQGITLMQDTP
jgi:hypothetical protein